MVWSYQNKSKNSSSPCHFFRGNLKEIIAEENRQS